MPCISRPYPVLTNVVSSITAYDLEFTVTPTHRLCDRLSTLWLVAQSWICTLVSAEGHKCRTSHVGLAIPPIVSKVARFCFVTVVWMSCIHVSHLTQLARGHGAVLPSIFLNRRHFVLLATTFVIVSQGNRNAFAINGIVSTLQCIVICTKQGLAIC